MENTESEVSVSDIHALARDLVRAFAKVQREWAASHTKTPNWALHVSVWLVGTLLAKTFDAPGNVADKDSRDALLALAESMELETSHLRPDSEAAPKARA